MKTEKFNGTIENAYGKPLPSPVKFEGTFEAFENYEELVEAKELPKATEIVAFINNKRKANARQQSMQAALDAAGIEKPTLESDVQLQLKGIIKSLIASGKPEDVAIQTAETLIGATYVR